MDTVKHVKLKKNMGFGQIIAALFFLFNPDISIIDVLPDFIGYMLMTSGLAHLAMINNELEAAYDKFKKMIVVALCKPAALFLLYGVFDSSEHASGNLLFAFSFAVVELIFVLPAYACLFDGILYLSGRRGAKAAFKQKGKKTVVEKAKSFTFVFVIAKAACAIIPETLSLTTTEYTDGVTMYLYDFIGHFRLIFFIVALVFGIIWLCREVKFFTAIKNEREFVESLSESFKEKLETKEGVFIQRNLYRGFLVLIAGALLCIDLHAPDLNVIPDCIAAIVFGLGAYLLGAYLIGHKKAMIASGVYFAISLIGSFLRISFLNEFGFFTAVNYKEEAFFAFCAMVGATVLENIAFLIVVSLVLIMLRDAVDKHTGSDIINEENIKGKRMTSVQRTLYIKLCVTAALAVIAAICSVLYDFLLIERGFFTDIMWAVDFTATAVFAGSFILTALAISDDIKSKYMFL